MTDPAWICRARPSAAYPQVKHHGRHVRIADVLARPWRKECVDPDHLNWGDAADNNADTVADGTHAEAAKTECPRHHRLLGQNIVPSEIARGWRACLVCARARNTRRDARRLRGEEIDLRDAVAVQMQRTDNGRDHVALAAYGCLPPAPPDFSA